MHGMKTFEVRAISAYWLQQYLPHLCYLAGLHLLAYKWVQDSLSEVHLGKGASKLRFYLLQSCENLVYFFAVFLCIALGFLGYDFPLVDVFFEFSIVYLQLLDGDF